MIFLNTALAASPRYRQAEEPPVSTYDVDFQAKIDYANVNAISIPSETQLAIENQRVIDSKAAGRWQKEDCYWDFTGEADQHKTWRLLDTKRLVQATATQVIWTSEGAEGILTPGTHINLNWIPSTGNYALNNSGICLWYFKEGSAFTSYGNIHFGVTGAGGDLTISPNSGTSSLAQVNQGYNTTTAFSSVGLTTVSRTSNTNVTIKTPSETRNLAYNSTQLPTATSFLLARNRVGFGVRNESDCGIKGLSIGADATADYDNIKDLF